RAGRGKKLPGWRDRIVSDLRLCRVMHWTYDELLDLPVDVYVVLVEELNRAHAKQKERRCRSLRISKGSSASSMPPSRKRRGSSSTSARARPRSARSSIG